MLASHGTRLARLGTRRLLPLRVTGARLSARGPRAQSRALPRSSHRLGPAAARATPTEHACGALSHALGALPGRPNCGGCSEAARRCFARPCFGAAWATRRPEPTRPGTAAWPVAAIEHLPATDSSRAAVVARSERRRAPHRGLPPRRLARRDLHRLVPRRRVGVVRPDTRRSRPGRRHPLRRRE